MAAINWTDRANEDLGQIEDYWLSVSAFSAQLQIQRIFDRVRVLASFPESGRIVPEMGHPAIREHIIGSYRLVYYTPSRQVLSYRRTPVRRRAPGELGFASTSPTKPSVFLIHRF